MMKDRETRRVQNNRWLIVMAACLTALVRAMFLISFRTSLLFPLFASAHDRMLYHAAAQAVANGHIWPDGAFAYMPLYPWLLGAMYACVGPSLMAAAVLGSVADCITAVCIVVLARRWGAHPVAVLVVAGLYAFYPLAIAYSGLTMPNSVNAMLVTLLILLMARSRLDRWLDGFLLGAFGGIVALGFAGALTLMSVYWAWELYKGWRNRALPWRGMAASVLLFACVLSPVAMHNTREEGSFVLLTTHGGFNFYMGNHERATGYPVRVENFRMTARMMLEDAHSFAEQAVGRELNHAESSRWWQQRAQTFWRNQPGRAMRLTIRKLRLFWNRMDVDDLRILEQLRITDGLFSSPLWPGFVWFGLLGGLGLLYARSAPVGRLALLTGWFSVALFFITARYRLTFVPLMAALGAAGVTALMDDLQMIRKRMKSGDPADMEAKSSGFMVSRRIWALPLLGVVFLPVQLPDLRPVDYHNVAIQLLATGDPVAALDIAERGLALASDSADLHHARGHALAELAVYEDAAAAFGQAAYLRPEHLTAQFNQALSLARMGDICGAVAVLQARLSVSPADARARSLHMELQKFCPHADNVVIK